MAVLANPCPDPKNCTFSGRADDLLVERTLSMVGETQLVADQFRLESDLGGLPANVRSVSIHPLRFPFGSDVRSPAGPWLRLVPLAHEPLGITIRFTVPGAFPTAASSWWFAVLTGSLGGGLRDFAVVPTLPDGSAGLVFTDKDGKNRIGLGVEPDGSPSLQLRDNDGKVRTITP